MVAGLNASTVSAFGDSVVDTIASNVVIVATYDYAAEEYEFVFFSSRRRHTRFDCDWSSDVCSSDLPKPVLNQPVDGRFKGKPFRRKSKVGIEPIVRSRWIGQAPGRLELLELQCVAFGENQGPLQFVRQLAHVSRPGIGKQPLPAFLRNRLGRQSMSLMQPRKQRLGQIQNILVP